eukprot:COSAG04_NODE_576_length_12493_cov_23.368323_1_plen_50_part_10
MGVKNTGVQLTLPHLRHQRQQLAQGLRPRQRSRFGTGETSSIPRGGGGGG